MLAFVIFAIVFFVVLFFAVLYLVPASRKLTSIPGEDPSDAREGNLLDIVKSEGLPNYLRDLNEKHGDVASFWLYGPSLTLSISSPDIIRKLHYLNDKPEELYAPLKPFVGESSLLFTNDAEARNRRKIWDKMFSEENLSKFESTMKQEVLELVDKWSKIPSGDHIPVGQYTKGLATKLCLVLAFGDYFKKSNKMIVDFGRSLEICVLCLESNFVGGMEEDQVRLGAFRTAVKYIRDEVAKAVDFNQEVEATPILLEALLAAEDISREAKLDDCMTFLLKIYSLSSALSWVLFKLASDAEAQEQITGNNKLIADFVTEVLATHAVESWTSRVNKHVDEDIGGHVVPKGTNLVFNLSDALKKEKVIEQKCKLIFGCHGSSRYCPASYFSNRLATLVVDYVTNNFSLDLVEADLAPQVVHKMIARSEGELWITAAVKK